MSTFPLPSFRFKVLLDGTEYAFQEVGAIKATIEHQTINDGTDITSYYRIPKRIVYDEVTLKKGIAKSGNSIIDLYSRIIESNDVTTPMAYHTVLIQLMDEKGKTPQITWELKNCWISGWEFSPLNAMNNEMAMETLTLSYADLKIRK
ncbi:phage tail protein [Saprospiraceae bacterium]|nr:phage tail protein [Saprospiraceae bacterium]